MNCEIIHRKSDVPLELVFFLKGAGFEIELVDLAVATFRNRWSDALAILALHAIAQKELDAVRLLAERRPYVLARRLDADTRTRVLGMGAAECLEFPKQLDELVLRLRRRVAANSGARADRAMAMFQVGAVTFDASARTMTHADGRRVRLTPMETRVLTLLAWHANSPVSRPHIDMELGRLPTPGMSRATDVTISGLRARLKEVGAPSVINTVRNRGYVLDGPWRRIATTSEQPPPQGDLDGFDFGGWRNGAPGAV